jgi:hypothetical protein
MSEILNRLGHLPQHVESENQIRQWVNALVWELDIDLVLCSSGEEPRDSRGLAVFNPFESQVFTKFTREATKMNRLYLELAIHEETRAKAIDDRLWENRAMFPEDVRLDELACKWAESNFELEEIWEMWIAGVYQPPCDLKVACCSAMSPRKL